MRAARGACGLLLSATLAACARESGRTTTARPTADASLEVVGTEYAFQAPDSVAPGRTVVRFRNLGRVVHELVVMKLKPGVSFVSLVALRGQREGFRKFLDGGSAVLFAPPAKLGDGALVVDFEPGREYAVWCNFRDGEGKPMHSAMGMYRRIRVGASKTAVVAEAPSAPRARDVKVREVVVLAGDYRFAVADTMSAGPVELRIRNVGRMRHEVAFGRLKAGVAASFFLEQMRRGLDVDSLYDDDGAIVTAYPDDDNRVAIRADLRRGHEYIILCEFRDHPDAPTHLELGMAKGIVVRGD